MHLIRITSLLMTCSITVSYHKKHQTTESTNHLFSEKGAKEKKLFGFSKTIVMPRMKECKSMMFILWSKNQSIAFMF